MSLEIFNLSNTSDFLGKIDSLDSIRKELETFKSSTGIIIDEYGTTRLYFDHVKLLLELISKETSDFKGILKKAVELKIGLLIEGD